MYVSELTALTQLELYLGLRWLLHQRLCPSPVTACTVAREIKKFLECLQKSAQTESSCLCQLS